MVTYFVREDQDGEPEISVPAEETPAPPEPVTDSRGRVEPTLSPATEETIPTQPVVEDTGFGGEYRVTFPETGNQYRINQYARDAGGGFFALVDGKTFDLADTVEASVQALGQIDSGAVAAPQEQAVEQTQPRQRRSPENENQTVIEFPDSGNTYTIEERTEGDTRAFYNVENGNLIGTNREEAIKNLRNVERLTSLTPDQDAQNMETIFPIGKIVDGLSDDEIKTNEGPSIPLSPIEAPVRDDMDILRFVMKLNVDGGESTVIPRVSARLDSFNSKAGTKGMMLDDAMEFDYKEFGSTSKFFRILNGQGEQSDGDCPVVQPDRRTESPVRLQPLIRGVGGQRIGSVEGDPSFFDNNDLIRQYSHSFLDMLELGFPVEFTNVSGVFSNPHRKHSYGTYYPAKRAISINPTLLRNATVPEGNARSTLLHILTHEHMHHADYSGAYSESIPEFGVSILSDASGDRLFTDTVELNLGDGNRELYDAYINGTELGTEFNYPFIIIAHRFKRIADQSRQGKVFTVESVNTPLSSLRKELFAQAGALFLTKPKLLKAEAPITYGILEKIFKQPNVPGQEIASGQSNLFDQPDRGSGDRFVLSDIRSLPVTRGDEISPPRGGEPIGERGGGVGDPSARVGGEGTTADGEQPGRLRPDVGDDISFEELSSESQKLTATPLLYGDETPRPIDGNPTVVKVAREFDEKAKEAYPDSDLSEQTDENVEIISDLIAHEAVQAINREGNAGEWYQQKVANAMELAAERYPELSSSANDRAPKFAFTAIMAVTSNGASVQENSVNTFKLYEDYRQNGEFTIFGVGKEGPAMKQSFKLLNALIKQDGIDNVMNFMNEDITVRELKNDFGLTVSGELQDTVLKGSAILGPKVGGGFYQNLNGNFDPLTMDRWFMRTYGRLTGSLMKESDRKYPIQLAKFREIALSDEYRNKLRRDGISRVKLKNDDSYAEAYIRQVQRIYANGNFKNKTEINLASNTFVKSQEEKQAPQNGTEREYIRRVMTRALDKVNQSNPDKPVNMGALQAIIWYPEKELYKQYGVGNKRSEPTDYETEFRKIIQGEEGGQGVPGPERSPQQRGTGRVQRTTGESQRDADQLDSSAVQEQTQEPLVPDEGDDILGRMEDPGQEPTPSFNQSDEILTSLDAETRFGRYVQGKRQSIVDRLERLKVLENRIADGLGLDRLPSELSAYDAENLMHSKVQKQLEDFEKEHVEPIADLVKSSGLDIDQVGLYLLAKHAPERNRRMFEKEQELREKQLAALEKQLEETEVQDPEGSPTIRQKIEDLQNAPFKFEDNGSGMTSAQAESVLQQADDDGKTDQLEAVSARIYKMLDEMRDNMVQKGLLDEDTRADWEDTYQFYVPLKGFAAYEEGLEIKGNPSASGFSIRGSESFKAKGRVTLPVNPLLVSFKDAEEKIVRAEKNQIAQRLLTMLSKNQDEDLWAIWNNKNRPYDPDNPVEKMTIAQMKRERRVDDGSYKYIQVKRGGQTFFIEIKDRELNRQLQGSGVGIFNMNVDHMGALLNGLTRFQNFRRNMLINYNPSWGLVNPIRDIQTGLAFALSEQDVAGGRLKDKEIIGKITTGYFSSLKAFYRYRRGREGQDAQAKEYDQFVKEYVEDGAPTGLSVTKSLEEQQRRFEAIVKQGKLKEKLRAGAKWVEDSNQTTENAVRLSAYVEARKAGVSRADAATLAKDLTVNFNRKGEYSSAIDSLYLFFNAAVQGNVNIAKALLRDGPEGKKVTRARLLAGSMVAFGFARTIANILNAGVDDDDEPVYKDYNEFALKSGMLFAFEGQGLSIPLPYGYGIFDNIGRYGAEFVMGVRTPGEVAANLTSSLDHHFNPMSLHASKDNAGFVDAALQKGIGLTPDVVQLGLELGMNINFFGSDIRVPQNSFLTPVPASQATKRGTNELIKGGTEFLNYATGSDSTPNAAKYRSGAIDINPEQVQHVTEFFLGGVGRFLDDTADTVAKMVAEDAELKSTDLPVLRTFMPLPSEYSDRMEYYANRNSYRQYRDQYRDATKAEREEIVGELGPEIFQFNVTDKSAEKRLRELSQDKKRLIQNEAMDPVVRFESIKKIDEQAELIYDKYNKAWRKIRP